MRSIPRPITVAVAGLLACVLVGACSDDAPDDASRAPATTSDSSVVITTAAPSSSSTEASSPTTATDASLDPSVTEPPAADLPSGFPSSVIFPPERDVVVAETTGAGRFTVVVAVPGDPDAVLADLVGRYEAAGWSVTARSGADEFVTGTVSVRDGDVEVTFVVEPAEAATAVSYDVTVG